MSYRCCNKCGAFDIGDDHVCPPDTPDDAFWKSKGMPERKPDDISPQAVEMAKAIKECCEIFEKTWADDKRPYECDCICTTGPMISMIEKSAYDAACDTSAKHVAEIEKLRQELATMDDQLALRLKEAGQYQEELGVLREALESYSTLPDGGYDGPDDYYTDLGAGANEALKRADEIAKGRGT